MYCNDRIQIFTEPPSTSSVPAVLAPRSSIPFNFANKKNIITDTQFAALQTAATTPTLLIDAAANVSIVRHPDYFLPHGVSSSSSNSAHAGSQSLPQSQILQKTVRRLHPSKRPKTDVPSSSSSQDSKKDSKKLNTNNELNTTVDEQQWDYDDIVDIKQDGDTEFLLLIRWYVCA